MRSWSIIGRGQLDAGDGHAALGERDGHAAGSDGELERSAVAGKFGEAVDRRPQHLGREHAGARGVVALGSIEIPDLLLAHGDDPGNGLFTTSNGFGERVLFCLGAGVRTWRSSYAEGTTLRITQWPLPFGRS